MKAGKLIKKAREKKGLSQLELGLRLGLTSAQYISNVERGLNGISPRHAKQVSETLGLSYEKLKKTIIKDILDAVEREFNGD